ncbi:hypothetical protein [Xenorhabdus eapokensis]|uniref:Uncharacterized protein n=1 Tax=Xenorhabdus eapokensis TaxID=1873482 RepID=A0A1Q5TGX4_9GAMM|nr:hypothetical protein [Xenorhabdus eapokensis]OKO99483.1 hypothetical protein Xedl_03632 [Xenorhabdus eapokensis]
MKELEKNNFKRVSGGYCGILAGCNLATEAQCRQHVRIIIQSRQEAGMNHWNAIKDIFKSKK